MVRLDVIMELEGLAEWFDNPNKSPFLAVKIGGHTQYTPGYLLRCISQALEAEGWNRGTLRDMRGEGPPRDAGSDVDPLS